MKKVDFGSYFYALLKVYYARYFAAYEHLNKCKSFTYFTIKSMKIPFLVETSTTNYFYELHT